MYSPSSGWAVAVWVVICFNFIWMCVIGYDCYYYWLFRDHSFFKPRMPYVTLMYIGSVYLISIHRIIDALIAMGYIEDEIELSRIISFVEIFPPTAMIVYKVWRTFYQYRYNEMVADQGWTVLLLLGNTADQDCENTQKWDSHWTIKYQGTLGSKKWSRIAIGLFAGLIPLIAILCLLCYIEYIANFAFLTKLAYFDGLIIGQTAMIVAMTVIVTPMAILKISKFTDLISIKYELIGICITYDIFGIMILPWVLFFHDNTIESRSVHVRIYLFVTISILCALCSFVMISWVLIKFKQSEFGKTESNLVSYNKLNNKLETSKQEMMNNNMSLKRNNNLSLNKVLAHKIGFRLFMRHLVNEFAVENLLFLTEVIQYKKSLLFKEHDTYSKTSKSANTIKFTPAELPAELPATPKHATMNDGNQSDVENRENRENREISVTLSQTPQVSIRKSTMQFPIITNEIPQSNIMKAENLFDKIDLIMQRYILDSASLQVNISYLNRHSLVVNQTQQLAGLKKQFEGNIEDHDEILLQLYQFFDQACEEIVRLLSTSFKNFTDTDAYKKFENET